jgi:hypothetical protein
MSYDSLIRSTIITRSQNNVSRTSKFSSSSVLSHDTKKSKISERANLNVFHP